MNGLWCNTNRICLNQYWFKFIAKLLSLRQYYNFFPSLSAGSKETAWVAGPSCVTALVVLDWGQFRSSTRKKTTTTKKIKMVEKAPNYPVTFKAIPPAGLLGNMAPFLNTDITNPREIYSLLSGSKHHRGTLLTSVSVNRQAGAKLPPLQSSSEVSHKDLPLSRSSEGPRFDPLRLSFLFKRKCVYGYCLVTLPTQFMKH